jgi:hypothetical protein
LVGARHAARILSAGKDGRKSQAECSARARRARAPASLLELRLMANRAINIAARILFFLSGLVSCAGAIPYVALRGSGLPYQNEWIIFAIMLPLAGVISVLAAILPASWTARICRVPDKSSVLSLPLKMFFGLAVVSYLLTIGLYFTPRAWNLEGFLLTFLLCPVYIVRTDLDPAPLILFGILGPVNAAVYGAIGVVLALARLAFRGRQWKKQ